MNNFSGRIKEELLALVAADHEHAAISLLAVLFATASLRAGLVQVLTAQEELVPLLAGWIQATYQFDSQLQAGKELSSLTIRDRNFYRAVADDLQAVFGYDAAINVLDQSRPLTQAQEKAIIRSFFLACGSVGDPRQSYHLEFSFKRQPAASLLLDLLARLQIKASLLKRTGYSVVYIKEGQQISDFLLYSGAHGALLDFESLRVDKEVRNIVNRVVNCDSANLQRIADASARQLKLLRQLQEANLLVMLPQELQAAALARLENPSFSLKELGETLQPPLGKSGMNHRLKKMEKMAHDLLQSAAL